jgi:CheY-like chemotaxis protein
MDFARLRLAARVAVFDRDPCPHDGLEASMAGGLVEARNSVEAVEVGERQGGVTELGGAVDEILGVRGGFEEGKGTGAAELDVVVGRTHRSIFVFSSPSVNHSLPPPQGVISYPSILFKLPVQPGVGMPSKVLVADDEELLRQLTQRVLAREGMAVVSAPDGKAALAALKADPEIGAAVLDVAMPSGGKGLLRKVVALRPGIGVVMISGIALPDGLEEALAACGGVFLRKPFAPRALVDALRRAGCDSASHS